MKYIVLLCIFFYFLHQNELVVYFSIHSHSHVVLWNSWTHSKVTFTNILSSKFKGWWSNRITLSLILFDDLGEKRSQDFTKTVKMINTNSYCIFYKSAFFRGTMTPSVILDAPNVDTSVIDVMLHINPICTPFILLHTRWLGKWLI